MKSQKYTELHIKLFICGEPRIDLVKIKVGDLLISSVRSKNNNWKRRHQKHFSKLVFESDEQRSEDSYLEGSE